MLINEKTLIKKIVFIIDKKQSNYYLIINLTDLLLIKSTKPIIKSLNNIQ